MLLVKSFVLRKSQIGISYRVVAIGDWVAGKLGVSNVKKVRFWILFPK